MSLQSNQDQIRIPSFKKKKPHCAFLHYVQISFIFNPKLHKSHIKTDMCNLNEVFFKVENSNKGRAGCIKRVATHLWQSREVKNLKIISQYRDGDPRSPFLCSNRIKGQKKSYTPTSHTRSTSD